MGVRVVFSCPTVQLLLPSASLGCKNIHPTCQAPLVSKRPLQWSHQGNWVKPHSLIVVAPLSSLGLETSGSIAADCISPSVAWFGCLEFPGHSRTLRLRRYVRYVTECAGPRSERLCRLSHLVFDGVIFLSGHATLFFLPFSSLPCFFNFRCLAWYPGNLVTSHDRKRKTNQTNCWQVAAVWWQTGETFGAGSLLGSSAVKSPVWNIFDCWAGFLKKKKQMVPQAGSWLGARPLLYGYSYCTWGPFSGLVNQMALIVLRVHTLINVFLGCMLSFYPCQNHKSSQIHTGPLSLLYRVASHDISCIGLCVGHHHI